MMFRASTNLVGRQAIWTTWIPWDLEPRTTVLVRAGSNLPGPTPTLWIGVILGSRVCETHAIHSCLTTLTESIDGPMHCPVCLSVCLVNCCQHSHSWFQAPCNPLLVAFCLTELCLSSLHSLDMDCKVNTTSNSFFVDACISMAMGMYLPSHCLAMDVSSGSAISALMLHCSLLKTALPK